MCDSYIGLDQSYDMDLFAINQSIKGQFDQGRRPQMDEPSMLDPEMDYSVDYGMQPQNLATPHFDDSDIQSVGVPEIQKYQSLYGGGFASYEQFQREIVEDIVSDEEGTKAQKRSKKNKEAEEHQIDSSAPNKAVIQNIEMGIDMLLDSDEDEVYEQQMRQEEDGMIEKDLDNWI